MAFENGNNEMRLQKYLALCGIASRRKAELMIAEGRVSVNGRITTEMGVRIVPGDVVECDGARVEMDEKKVYILLNKPRGVVTTSQDQFGRKNVLDLVEGVSERIYPVGRLDYHTSGIILLTNDGELAYKLSHPSHQFKKVYLASCDTPMNEEIKHVFREGIEIDGRKTAPAFIESLGGNDFRIVLLEGRNREIRRLFEAAGVHVRKLSRVALGPIDVGDLRSGEWRYLNADELKLLKKEVGMA